MYAITLLINQHVFSCPKKKEKERSGESPEEEKTALGVHMTKDSILAEPIIPRRSKRRNVSATTVQEPKLVKKIRF